MDAQATIQALVRLIDDPDEMVFQQVRDELMKFGTQVLPVLEQSWEQDYYGLLFQDRVENLIHDIQFETVKAQLTAWLQSPDKDLLRCDHHCTLPVSRTRRNAFTGAHSSHP